MPAALWLLAGSDPFPTSLPTKETLTGQLTFTTLLNVLLFVVWLAWLFFVVCVAWRSRRRGVAGWRSRCPSAGRCRSSRAPWSVRCSWPR